MVAANVSTAVGAWFKPGRRPLTSMLGTGFLSLISNQLTGLAVPWFVLELTGSAGKMGITAAATMLPSVVMMFVGGAIADRTAPKRLSVFADVLSGITVALVPLLFVLDMLTFPLLLALMVAGAIFDTPGYSARSKMLPQLAEKAGVQIERVTSLQGVFQAISMLFGAILAGVLISALGATNVLWINAAAFAVSAAVIWLMVPNLYVPREEMPSVVDDVRQGFQYVTRHPILRPITLAALVVNAMFVPVTAVLLPYMAKTEWNSATAFGLMISGFGAGALLGSVAMSGLSERMRRSVVLRLSLVLLSFPMLILAMVPSLPIAWIATFLIGVGTGIVNPMLQALVFRTTAPELLGRVNGVISAGAMVASPLGVMVATPILSAYGLSVSYSLIGGILILNLLMLLRSPMMRLIDDATAEQTATEDAESTIENLTKETSAT